MFCAFVPVPGQTVLAIAGSIVIGCNLPVALCTVMITNPLTVAPLFIAAYKLGAWLWNAPPTTIEFELSLNWLRTEFAAIWEPFVLGCFALGASTAAIGHGAVRLIWRIHVVTSWRERRRRPQAPQAPQAPMSRTVISRGVKSTREPEPRSEIGGRDRSRSPP